MKPPGDVMPQPGLERVRRIFSGAWRMASSVERLNSGSSSR